MTFMNMLAEKSGKPLCCKIIKHYVNIPHYYQNTTEHPDITQEVASRGMGLVYEMSPPSEREALVNLLVGTLMEGRKYCQPCNN